MSQLETLAQHHHAILMAEAIGWLHDYRKCSDEILQGGGLPRPALLQKLPTLSGVTLSIPAISLATSIEQLLHEWGNKANDPNASLLLQYISRCHHTAHFDKQEPVGGAPNYPVVQISSAFGFARDIPVDLTSKLWSLPWNSLVSYSSHQRELLRNAISNLFSLTIADTRHPINEVDLWSWGMLVGALYKAAIAGALLGHQVAAHDLRWRLLSVRLDGLSYILGVSRLPDLLARQSLITDGLNRVRELLEVSFPIGGEVYRDEAGSLFIVPDLPNLLHNFTNQQGQSLEQLILHEFAHGGLGGNSSLPLGKEVVPQIQLESISWWGQDPDWMVKQQSGQPIQNEMPSVGQLLSASVSAYPEATSVQVYWQNQHGEICTTCGLRPQGSGRKAQERKVCDTCEQRRADRSLKWATGQIEDTIWLDEVSDSNGRIALITGHFDLTHWLDGGLVESLALIAPNGIASEVKSGSFSRIRRIWETTRRFWHEVQEQAYASLSDDRRRLQFWLDRVPNLGAFHVYELNLGQTTLSVVWYPPKPDGSGGYFISADNLGYIARQLGAEPEIYSHPAAAAIFVEDNVQEHFIKRKQPPVLRNPELTATNLYNEIAGDSIIRLQHQATPYSTAIPILAEPRTFMALVPADKALGMMQAIKVKYEREMGKVRNRLPLHLGVVYAHRRTPLRAVLDAGRRMLHQKPLGGEQTWTVKADAQRGVLPPEKQGLANGTHHFEQTIAVQLEQNGRTLDWHVPAVMGDGHTEDRWYPYVFLETNGDDTRLNGRTGVFKGRRPTETGAEEGWLVHAAKLRQGDQVYFTAATFDFEWLDASARRFEIAYNDEGERYGRLARPYLLDDLESIQQAWHLIAGADGLSSSQIYALRDTIEARRETWRTSPHNETFRQLCRDAICNAEWRKRPALTSIERLTHWAVTGLLADTVELYMGVMKQKPQQK